MATKNARILVNFKQRKITHSFEHEGSDKIAQLKKAGYIIVGEAKPDGKFFWDSNYFDPDTKYPIVQNIETIKTSQ